MDTIEGLNIVAVQFRQAGKLYDFASKNIDLHVGDQVIVETDRGPSLAKVAKIRYQETRPKSDRKLKSIMRRATENELAKKSRLSESEVTNFTKGVTEKLELKMKILKSEVQFGGNKVIVYFTAPGRVDFRALVKELANGLKTRVELTQVGARDETKLLGGIGICGREYCCSTFLREFLPVSIKMAKNQNLALNPSKVSGGCGRLLCCLTYEDDVYTDLRQNLPPRGTKLKLLERGEEGVVIRCDVLNQLVLVRTEQATLLVPLKETEVIPRPKAVGRKSRPEDKDKSSLTQSQKARSNSSANKIAGKDNSAAKAKTQIITEEAEAWGEDLDLELLSGGNEKSDTRSQNNPKDRNNGLTEEKSTEASKDSATGSRESQKSTTSQSRGRSRNRNRGKDKKK